MSGKIAVSLLSLVVAAMAFAAPPNADPVAEGFPSWEGVTEKNYIRGRVITPSDLRHRVVVMVTLKDDANLQKNFLALSKLVQDLDETPPGHAAQWDTMDQLPRKCIILVSFRDGGKNVADNIKAALKPPKDMNDNDSRALTTWSSGVSPAFYKDVALFGSEAETEFPYIRVLDGKKADPVYKGVFKAAEAASIRKNILKCKRELGEWRDMFGVMEVEHFKDVEKKMLSGKPLKPCLAPLKAGIGDKNQEKAREAQIMYDAINQFSSDLKHRITLEYRAAPARAFVDAQKLFRYFPQEKKSLAQVDLFLKNNKSTLTLGKMYEKYLEWSHPDFTFKNTSDAKKAVQLVNSWKKPLEKMAADTSNTVLQGEASLILAQIDSIGDLLMTKVPQK